MFKTDMWVIVFILIMAVVVVTISWSLGSVIQNACPKGIAHCAGETAAEMEKGFREGRGGR